MGNNIPALYQLQELSIRTLYAEVSERASAAGELLAGTPGTLVKRSGTGYEYWYRAYYPFPQKRREEFVGSVSDEVAHAAMLGRMDHAAWTSKQVSTLAKLGYQVADKGTASVAVELHNRQIFAAGLIVVGTLAYMAWLNEYGVISSTARTQDIDLARGHSLKLGTPIAFMSTMQATQLPFARVPGLPSTSPSTSVKLPGTDGLRVDILAPGNQVGRIVSVPELEWHAQTVPYYEYLLDSSRAAALLAGGHCIPIRLPDPARLMWHKLYSSTSRSRSPSKSAKDLKQAATLAAILVEHDNLSLRASFREAPPMVRSAAQSRFSGLDGLLTGHPQVREEFKAL